MKIRKARIRFLEGGVPFSDEFGDVYFSPEGGLAETEHVFLAGNDLPARWHEVLRFEIGELGFGTGLNFLTTVQHWHRTRDAHPDAWLHFHSCELFPLGRDDHARALEFWPALKEISDLLIRRLPLPVHGLHVVDFPEFRVTLHLFLGPVERFLTDVEFTVDAWFLDGFAPSKNQAMWGDSIARLLALRTREGGTAATFSVAAPVKQGLRAGGFDISKRKGFGRKREMLVAILRTGAERRIEPDFFPRAVLARPIATAPGRVAVIGAGLAGAWIAHELSKRGREVTVFDRNVKVASEASGNPGGIYMPYLSASESETSEYALLSLSYLMSVLDRISAGAGFKGASTGVTEVLVSEEDQVRYLRAMERLGLDGDFSELFEPGLSDIEPGLAIEKSVALHKRAGWLSPRDLVGSLLGEASPGVRLRLGVNVEQLESVPGGWRIAGDIFEQVVLATSNNTVSFEQGACLPLTPLRGQIAELAESSLAGGILRRPLVAQEYLCPTGAATLVLGATFDLKDDSTQLDAQKNLRTLERLRADVGDEVFSSLEGFDPARGRVAFRCTTSDKLPVVGALPDAQFYITEYARFFRGKAKAGDTPAPPRLQPGLFVLTGFGSRGITYAPLAARALASEMLGEPGVLSEPLRKKLHPARFLIRALRRGQPPATPSS